MCVCKRNCKSLHTKLENVLESNGLFEWKWYWILREFESQGGILDLIQKVRRN
jgi:hypothetical protein